MAENVFTTTNSFFATLSNIKQISQEIERDLNEDIKHEIRTDGNHMMVERDSKKYKISHRFGNDASNRKTTNMKMKHFTPYLDGVHTGGKKKKGGVINQKKPVDSNYPSTISITNMVSRLFNADPSRILGMTDGECMRIINYIIQYLDYCHDWKKAERTKIFTIGKNGDYFDFQTLLIDGEKSWELLKKISKIRFDITLSGSWQHPEIALFRFARDIALFSGNPLIHAFTRENTPIEIQTIFKQVSDQINEHNINTFFYTKSSVETLGGASKKEEIVNVKKRKKKGGVLSHNLLRIIDTNPQKTIGCIAGLLNQRKENTYSVYCLSEIFDAANISIENTLAYIPIKHHIGILNNVFKKLLYCTDAPDKCNFTLNNVYPAYFNKLMSDKYKTTQGIKIINKDKDNWYSESGSPIASTSSNGGGGGQKRKRSSVGKEDILLDDADDAAPTAAVEAEIVAAAVAEDDEAGSASDEDFFKFKTTYNGEDYELKTKGKLSIRQVLEAITNGSKQQIITGDNFFNNLDNAIQTITIACIKEAGDSLKINTSMFCNEIYICPKDYKTEFQPVIVDCSEYIRTFETLDTMAFVGFLINSLDENLNKIEDNNDNRVLIGLLGTSATNNEFGNNNLIKQVMFKTEIGSRNISFFDILSKNINIPHKNYQIKLNNTTNSIELYFKGKIILKIKVQHFDCWNKTSDQIVNKGLLCIMYEEVMSIRNILDLFFIFHPDQETITVYSDSKSAISNNNIQSDTKIQNSPIVKYIDDIISSIGKILITEKNKINLPLSPELIDTYISKINLLENEILHIVESVITFIRHFDDGMFCGDEGQKTIMETYLDKILDKILEMYDVYMNKIIEILNKLNNNGKNSDVDSKVNNRPTRHNESLHKKQVILVKKYQQL